MTIKLNFWQTLGLFLPFTIGALLFDFSSANLNIYLTNAAIANLLMVLNVFLVINYQGFLVLRFNYLIDSKSNLIKVNAYIPMVFITLYFLYVGYLTFNNHVVHNPGYSMGPMRKASLAGPGWVFMLFLVHAFITFYFINNQFVSKKIKVITDMSRQESLKSDFLVPMKMLVKISIWVFVGFLILSTVADITTYSLKSK